MSDVLLQLLFGLACIGLGFFAGLSMGWREYRIAGKAVPAPTLPKTDRQQAYWLIVVGVLAVASTTFAGIQSSHQAECNAEFQSTSLELRRIASEDRALEAQDDQLRNERDDAMTLMIETLLTPPPPGQRVDAVAALNRYRTTAHSIDTRRDQLTAERAGLERQRQEQPTPKARC
ncbi:hypothetical protein ACWFRF_20915 [Nocardia sp. NPDC055165]